MIRIHVAGTPRPQPRPRFWRGRVVSTGNRLSQLWRVLMEVEFRKHAPQGGPICCPVRVDCLAMFPTRHAERWGKPHTIRPDRDNVEKGVLDVLVKARVLKDDAIVSSGSFRKVWAERGGLDVRISYETSDPAADPGGLRPAT